MKMKRQRPISPSLFFFSLVCGLLLATRTGAQQSGWEWQPPQASTLAGRIDWLFNYLLIVSGIIAGGVCTLICVFVYRYRRGSRVSRKNPPIENPLLEAAWIGIPIVLSVLTFYWASRIYFDLFNVPPGAININVVGKQWFWELQHPEGAREMNELHVPVGRPVKLTLTSEDVIHSFFVPAFRIKQDVLPDRVVETWFTATKPGQYHLFCSQYCGTQHANMVGWVYVMEPADFEKWLQQTRPHPSLAKVGERLFVQFSCTGCHGPQAAVRAPSLDGIYGKPVPLADGSMVNADERYIYDSIVLPGSQVVAGYQNVMPSYKGAMNQEQLLALVAYIRSLGSGEVHEKPTEVLTPASGQRIEEQRQRAKAAQQETKGVVPSPETPEMTAKRPPSSAMPAPQPTNTP